MSAVELRSRLCCEPFYLSLSMLLSILRSVIRLSVWSSDGPVSSVDSIIAFLFSPHSPQLGLAEEYVSFRDMALETRREFFFLTVVIFLVQTHEKHSSPM